MDTMTAPGIGVARVSVRFPVADQVQIGALRLRAAALGRAHGLDADAVTRLGLVVTALAANIVRHARQGDIVLRPVGEHETGCIEVLALDKGPGIADMTRAMREGALASSGDRRESGFATIRRLADLFDIHSHPGRGTAVLTHVGSREGKDAAERCSASVVHQCLGVVSVPLKGEDECGDDWTVSVADGRAVALLVDGLGHGPGAAVAALAALSAFPAVASRKPELMLATMHDALHHTRGAALSVTVIDRTRRTASFCGVGNVDGRVITRETNRQLMPQSGIVGHAMPRLQASEVPWPLDACLIMHSDGISSRWRTDQYPGLLARHPALIAGVIFRDCARDRDDATVLVLRDVFSTQGG
jgi:anti-sigma regulatory factor (Ser/Thr protein kinase)